MIDQKRPSLRVVVVTDQRLLAAMVKLTLERAGCITRDASSARGAMTIMDEWRPHVAIVDLDGGGAELLRAVTPDRPGAATRIPTLAVTHCQELATKLAIFNDGADDVMTVPLCPEELAARVLAIGRRIRAPKSSPKPVVRLGELRFDTLKRQARIGSSNLKLTTKEQGLLYLLASNAGQVVTYDEIIDALWGIDYAPDSNVVARHIRTLRAKMQHGGRDGNDITTVPGRGYRLQPIVSEHARAS